MKSLSTQKSSVEFYVEFWDVLNALRFLERKLSFERIMSAGHACIVRTLTMSGV